MTLPTDPGAAILVIEERLRGIQTDVHQVRDELRDFRTESQSRVSNLETDFRGLNDFKNKLIGIALAMSIAAGIVAAFVIEALRA